MMHGREKSGSAIVAAKPTNKAERSAAEPVERRAEAKGNAGQQSTHRAQDRERVSKALACIRQLIIAVDTRGGSRMKSHGEPRLIARTLCRIASHSDRLPRLTLNVETESGLNQ
jgi:hypothetical protein